MDGGILMDTSFPSVCEEQPESVFLTLDMVDYFELATKIWVDNPIQCPMGCAPLLDSPNLHSFFFISERDMTGDKKWNSTRP